MEFNELVPSYGLSRTQKVTIQAQHLGLQLSCCRTQVVSIRVHPLYCRLSCQPSQLMSEPSSALMHTYCLHGHNKCRSEFRPLDCDFKSARTWKVSNPIQPLGLQYYLVFTTQESDRPSSALWIADFLSARTQESHPIRFKPFYSDNLSALDT
jgi:hypothetical protein